MYSCLNLSYGSLWKIEFAIKQDDGIEDREHDVKEAEAEDVDVNEVEKVRSLFSM